MVDDSTAQLVNLATGETVALLNETQLQELKMHLQVESLTDTSFYITPETLDFLRMRDAHDLASLLAPVLGDRDAVPIGYAPISTGPARAYGRLRALESNAPLIGYKAMVYDEDIIFDDLIGWCYSNHRGEFELRFGESDYKDLAPPDLEGEPELKLQISDIDGEEVGWAGLIRDVNADFGDMFVSASGKLIAPVVYPGTRAICPKCGMLYRAGFSICSDDQVPLRPLAAG
jgi:hypothetical protein